MLNEKVGTLVTEDGRARIRTAAGTRGHAVYGQYDPLEPGDYVVEFTMVAPTVSDADTRKDQLCAIVDVAYDTGVRWVAREEVYLSQLKDGAIRLTVPFTVTAPGFYECRVFVTGVVDLEIDDNRPITPIPVGTSDRAALIEGNRFPGEAGREIPFFRDNEAMFRNLYEQGNRVAIVDGAPVLTVRGISLFARSHEEIIFVGEVLHEGAYNFSLAGQVCAIDIGMNVGLTSLLFASRPEVAEIHAFEPFPATFAKARDNLSLNPALAAKITANPFGLSDRDHDGTVMIDPGADLGAKSTVGVPGGVPAEIVLRDAGAILSPIIADARERGMAVVVKVDCEGSEFAIFAAMERAGLLPLITAFMVEWHAMFAGKTQEDLIAPLRRHGFVVFDRSPPVGNGFFYAARIAAG